MALAGEGQHHDAPPGEDGSDLTGLVDVEALTGWARLNLPGVEAGQLEVSRITSGGANELFELRCAGDVWVLRRPLRVPQDADASNKIMAREHRLLTALAESDVPHPTPVALCVDVHVIGSAFYVMEKIGGFTTDGALPEVFAADPEAQRAIGLTAIDALASLHAVDWKAAGLDGFGRPEGFLGRQVDRWSGQLEKNRTRELPGLDSLAVWLQSNQPPDGVPAVMHGDYTPHNWMFAEAPPTELLAVVDWEQATIGDPLLDVGHLLAGWSDPGEGPRFASYLQPREHLPTRAELLERYAARTGRDVTPLPFYEVLAAFKLACVLEGNYRLHVTGQSSNPKHRRAGELVVELIDAAHTAITS